MGQLEAQQQNKPGSTTVNPEVFELPRAARPRHPPGHLQAIALHYGVLCNRDSLLIDQRLLERQPALNLFNIDN